MMKTGGSIMKGIKKMGIALLFLLMIMAKNSNAIIPADYGMDYDYFVNVVATQTIRGDKTFKDEIVFEKYVTFGASVAITGVTYSTATFAQDSDLLDGNDSLYYAIKADVISSTDTLQSNINTEITNRISEDNLISDATGQIRIDFEAYDSTLDTSTTTLRSDLVSEIASRISEDNLISDATGQIRTDLDTAEIDITNLETSTSTLEGRLDTAEIDITNLETSTSTLEGRLDTAESDITSIGSSTSTLRTAVDLNTIHRGSNGTDHTYIDQDITITSTPTFNGIEVNNYIQFKTSTTVGLQGTTPTALGQVYWNTDTSEFWISTGTAINQFISK